MSFELVRHGAYASEHGACASVRSRAPTSTARQRVRPAGMPLVLLAWLVVTVAGCGTLIRNPVPPELTNQAIVPGMPDVRAWAAHASPVMQNDMVLSFTYSAETGAVAGCNEGGTSA